MIGGPHLELTYRSMESQEEIKGAAAKFGKLMGEAEQEGKEKHADILDTSASLLYDTNLSGQQYR